MRRVVVVLNEIAARLTAEIEALVAQLDTDGGVIQQTAYNANNVARIRAEVLALAEQEGVPSVLEVLRGELPGVIQQAIADYPVPDDAIAVITEDLLAVVEGQEAEVARVIGGGSADAVASAVRQSLTGALDVAALQANVARALDTSLGRAAVALDRAVREVQDRALILAGEAADETFVYVYTGPDDAVTRPYCEARVGRYLTQEQANALDPAERYNCRHLPAPLPLREALAQGIPAFEGE